VEADYCKRQKRRCGEKCGFFNVKQMVHIVTAGFLMNSLFGKRHLNCHTFERDGGILN
jgi:hypothetical protein